MPNAPFNRENGKHTTPTKSAPYETLPSRTAAIDNLIECLGSAVQGLRPMALEQATRWQRRPACHLYKTDPAAGECRWGGPSSTLG